MTTVTLVRCGLAAGLPDRAEEEALEVRLAVGLGATSGERPGGGWAFAQPDMIITKPIYAAASRAGVSIKSGR
jgi:hypothetical protein